MKKISAALLLIMLCAVLLGLYAEKSLSQPAQATQKMYEQHYFPGSSRPDTLEYQFSIAPLNLLMSYYDYMIGSYNNIPLWKNPDPVYGGYFLTFHGKRTPTGIRKVLCSYISDSGVVHDYTEIPGLIISEGYPSLAIDEVAGKPMYAWHGNYDGDTDPAYEVVFAYDAYLNGNPGLLSYPQVIIDNPLTLPPPYNTNDNEFIWSTVQTGPSPVPGMRRVYVLARNTTIHTAASSQNVIIAYTDFNAQMLESGANLSWDYTSIPLLDDWNHFPDMLRRLSGSFAAGADGKIYYICFHTASDLSTGAEVEEPDVSVFICDNYGTGNWTRVTGDSRYQGWNPPENYGYGDGFFKLSDNLTPVPDDWLKWKIMNSSHFNAVVDNHTGQIQMPSLWTLYFAEPIEGVPHLLHYPNFHTVKELVYDINSQLFEIREVHPKAGTAGDDMIWMPWDTDGDGIVDAYYTNLDNPQDPLNGTPLMQTTWPFPHWDNALHNGTMMFHYNNIKITQPDPFGNMAIVWQDSNRARLYNTNPNAYPDFAPFAGTPEIMIACSRNFGQTWSESVSLNNVETQQLVDMNPMWVYPVNRVNGYLGSAFTGKLAMMFYDDFDWGSYQLINPAGQNDGGYIKFMELDFTATSAWDETAVTHLSALKQNFPNPFTSLTTINFNLPKDGKAELAVYNLKGQLVKMLKRGQLAKGENAAYWDGTDDTGTLVSAGIYFYSLTAEAKTDTRKMLLLK